MTGSACARTPCNITDACLAATSAAFSAVIASATLLRSATSVTVVNAAFPRVNDPLGKCFSVPAMRACTSAKAAALDFVDMVVLDIDNFSFPSGGRGRPVLPVRCTIAPGGRPPGPFGPLIETV